MNLQRTIKAVVRKGDIRYVAECVEVPVITQGMTLDETIANLRETVVLHLQDENLLEIGLAADPTLIVTMELDPVHA